MTKYTAGVIVKQPGKPQPRARWAKYIILSPLLLLLLLPLLYFTNTAQCNNMALRADVADALTSSLNGFTMDLYMEMSRKKPDENLFFSPLSVMTAMGMTLMGSRGNTQKQLREVIKMGQELDQVSAAFGSLISTYKTEAADYEFRTANLMYVSNALELRRPFGEAITGPFQATAKVVDFGGHTEEVRSEINAAVNKATNSKIPELIPEGVLGDLTRLVLVNAVYFKGFWAHAFNKSLTRDEPFYTSDDTHVMVPMMSIEQHFMFEEREDLGAKVLSMDYKGSSFSLVIILPNERTGLAAVQQKVASMDLLEIASKGNKRKVIVQLPRFKLEYSEDLVDTLKALGAADMFGGKSDLSGIGGDPGELFVSNVLHKAVLEVNEKGTEAAAATAMMMRKSLLMNAPPTPEFIANRPFMFYILDRSSNTLLFFGKLTRPTLQ